MPFALYTRDSKLFVKVCHCRMCAPSRRLLSAAKLLRYTVVYACILRMHPHCATTMHTHVLMRACGCRTLLQLCHVSIFMLQMRCICTRSFVESGVWLSGCPLFFEDGQGFSDFCKRWRRALYSSKVWSCLLNRPSCKSARKGSTSTGTRDRYGRRGCLSSLSSKHS